jgi:NAD+ kinase
MNNCTFGIFELKTHAKEEILNLIKNINVNSDFTFVKNCKNADYIIAYGGDGTLLDAFQKFPEKIIIPIRDYAKCELHKNLKNYFTNNNLEIRDVIKCKTLSKERYGISEVVIRNDNISQAIRFDLYINDKPYALNCIGDGLIISTVLGSTGYFKNITNMFFTEGIGIGFLNNAQRMSNLIISKNSKIKIIIQRGNIELGIDHQSAYLIGQQILEIEIDNIKTLKLLNYKENFMCNDCRNNRHSGYVNSIYSVI